MDLKAIRHDLASWNNFEECLLRTIRSIDGLYSLELVFNSIRERHSSVIRADLDAELLLVTLRLEGVEEVAYSAALTGAMRAQPSEIGWGFGEVAGVEVTTQGEGMVLTVQWEGDRSLVIACNAAGLHAGGAER